MCHGTSASYVVPRTVLWFLRGVRGLRTTECSCPLLTRIPSLNLHLIGVFLFGVTNIAPSLSSGHVDPFMSPDENARVSRGDAGLRVCGLVVVKGLCRCGRRKWCHCAVTLVAVGCC